MHKYLSSSLNSVVSLDVETSWAARSLKDALEQARFENVRIYRNLEIITLFNYVKS